ncbi:MAG TPA: hypothetical protein VFO38_00525 [Candidatus Saccharimonadales bacterium]|nr:hypothetical protein [Candidatus Saccharimonadales bacterium]
MARRRIWWLLGSLLGVALLVAGLLVVLADEPVSKQAVSPNDLIETSDTLDFRPAAEYQLQAELGGGGMQYTSVRLGAPRKAGDFEGAHRYTNCAGATQDDVMVPFRLDMKNVNNKAVRLIMSVGVALNPGRTGGAFFWDSVFQECTFTVVPALGPATAVASAGKVISPTSLSYGSPSEIQPDQILSVVGFFALTGAGKFATPPPSEVFLRLSPISSNEPVPYRITRLRSMNDGQQAGMVTQGADKDAYYIPLDGKSSPCGPFAQNEPNMKCGSQLPG